MIDGYKARQFYAGLLALALVWATALLPRPARAQDMDSPIMLPKVMMIHPDIPRMPLENYVSEADEIVWGTVTSIQTGTAPGTWDEMAMPAYVYTVDIWYAVKGTLGSWSQVQFHVAGGETAEYAVRLKGAPTFEIDEEVMIFLDTVDYASFGILGLADGVYRMTEAPTGDLAVAGLHAAHFEDPWDFFYRLEELYYTVGGY